MTRDSNPSRRQVVAGMLGGAVAASLAPLSFRAQAAAKRLLKDAAAAKGILFGSAIGVGKPGTLTASFADPAYLEIVKAQCAILVPENEFKLYVIGAEQGRYDFRPGDQIASFARANNQRLRGHTLLWNHPKYLPKWVLDSSMSAASAEQFLRDYIKRVCTHYGDQIHSWDVVNETLDPETGELRDTPFTRALGFNVMRITFEAAREFAPKAQLVYNDYMSWEAKSERHRQGVLKLLEQMRAKNIPIDALGVQGHIGTDDNSDAAQRKQWRVFLDQVVAMKYKLLITEFDVNDKNLPGDFAARDAQVAATAKDYLDLMLAYRELDQVLCWGLVDKYSWLQGFSKRTDKLPQRPTPFDSAYQPKPLFDAIANAFAAAPSR